jgi:lipopolysaccharide export system permease protein
VRLLDRLVTTTFLRIYIAFLIGAPILFVIGDFNENLDDYIDRGLSMAEVGTAYLYQMPKFILWAFPVAALVGAVFTVQGMTLNREVMAAKAGGVSFHRLVLPLLIMGVLLTGGALWLTEVVPRTNRMASEILLDRDSRRDWRANFVFQGDEGRMLAIQRLAVGEDRIQDVMVEDPPGGPGEPAVHTVARAAGFSEESGWTFEDGYVRQLYAEGTEVTFAFEEMRTRAFTERPFELLESPLEEEEMTYAEMGRMVDVVTRSGGDASEYRYKRERKLAIPFATFVVILFGAPLATTSKRGGPAFGIGVALGSTILYMLLLKLVGAFGAAGNISPYVAAWTPNAVFLVAGAALMFKVRT